MSPEGVRQGTTECRGWKGRRKAVLLELTPQMGAKTTAEVSRAVKRVRAATLKAQRRCCLEDAILLPGARTMEMRRRRLNRNQIRVDFGHAGREKRQIQPARQTGATGLDVRQSHFQAEREQDKPSCHHAFGLL